MTPEEFEKLMRESFERRLALSARKAADYATTDKLSNFKRIATAVGALNIPVGESWGYALFMCLMKIDRIVNIMSRGGTATNEGLRDSWDDLKNYADLAEASWIEASKETPKQ